jgi:hypothetical protein
LVDRTSDIRQEALPIHEPINRPTLWMSNESGRAKKSGGKRMKCKALEYFDHTGG